MWTRIFRHILFHLPLILRIFRDFYDPKSWDITRILNPLVNMLIHSASNLWDNYVLLAWRCFANRYARCSSHPDAFLAPRNSPVALKQHSGGISSEKRALRLVYSLPTTHKGHKHNPNQTYAKPLKRVTKSYLILTTRSKHTKWNGWKWVENIPSRSALH